MQKLILLTALILLPHLSWGRQIWTDDDFKNLLIMHQQGIIYLWSPLMPLSFLGRQEIQSIALELDAALTLTVDPLAPLSSTADPAMACSTLMKFGMLDHYPAIALYKNGHLIQDALVLGYESPKTLRQLLKSYFEKEN
jgi:hypothetical protein